MAELTISHLTETFLQSFMRSAEGLGLSFQLGHKIGDDDGWSQSHVSTLLADGWRRKTLDDMDVTIDGCASHLANYLAGRGRRFLVVSMLAPRGVPCSIHQNDQCSVRGVIGEVNLSPHRRKSPIIDRDELRFDILCKVQSANESGCP